MAEEITWRWLGRVKRMRWEEIGRIRNRDLWGALELYHRDGACSKGIFEGDILVGFREGALALFSALRS